MIPFELAEPRSFKEAISLLDGADETVRPIAGGTALMLMMKAGVFRPTRLVSLRKVKEDICGIKAGADGNLTIGAMVSLSAVECSPEVTRHAPAIVHTMRRLANVRVRNVATIGGSLAHGDPHMDLPPVLIALGASVAVLGPSGGRTAKLEELYTGYFETELERNELICELRVPSQGKRRSAYLKCTTGTADDWPALGIAVSLDADERAVRSATIVVSAAVEKATRLVQAESVLAGATIDDAVLRRAGDAAAEEAQTIGDVRGSAAYKRELIRVCLARAVGRALAADGGRH
jgi:aerobic carbon-monoxide dehydrogenase medium subunit